MKKYMIINRPTKNKLWHFDWFGQRSLVGFFSINYVSNNAKKVWAQRGNQYFMWMIDSFVLSFTNSNTGTKIHAVQTDGSLFLRQYNHPYFRVVVFFPCCSIAVRLLDSLLNAIFSWFIINYSNVDIF